MTNVSRRQFVQHMLVLSMAGSGTAMVEEKTLTKRHQELSNALSSLTSPVLFAGDSKTAYRDPAAILHDGWFYLFFTLVKTEADGIPYSYVAWSKSRQMKHWTPPNIITKKSRNLDFGSPGDIIRFKDRWILCVQTYPRPNGEKFGNGDSRIWTMSSPDLEHWDAPELLRVSGPNQTGRSMGRIIDPYILEDKDEPGVWWCFYKSNGIRVSRSVDLKNWIPMGFVSSGENPCVIVDKDEYLLFYSPENGIGIKRSGDLENWRDEGFFTLGQQDWPWARGRITAGFVLDLRGHPEIGKALMFFHGSRYAEEDSRGGFDTFASLGIAWSSDLSEWHWPNGYDRAKRAGQSMTRPPQSSLHHPEEPYS